MTSKEHLAYHGCLWTGLLLLRTAWSIQLVIEQGPQSVVAFPGNVVTFTCSGSGTLYMTINGTSESQVSSGLRTDMDLWIYPARFCTHKITFIAKEEYNNTLIQCVAVDEGDIESDNAALIVQGPLGEVTDLHFVNSSDSIAVFWSAPFSLDVTGVDPDIWYSVLIYNVTDEENPTAIPCIDCHNLTQTHYIFSPDYPSPCHKYTFTVISFNGAGQGVNSTSDAATFTAGPVIPCNGAEQGVNNSTSDAETFTAGPGHDHVTLELQQQQQSTEQQIFSLRELGIGIAIGGVGMLLGIACIVFVVAIVRRQGKGSGLKWNKQSKREQQNAAYDTCTALPRNVNEEKYTSCVDEYVIMGPVYEKI